MAAYAHFASRVQALTLPPGRLAELQSTTMLVEQLIAATAGGTGKRLHRGDLHAMALAVREALLELQRGGAPDELGDDG